MNIDDLADHAAKHGPPEPEPGESAPTPLREYIVNGRPMLAPDDVRPGDIIGPPGELVFVVARTSSRLTVRPGGDSW